MSAGACPCGYTSASCKKVKTHMLSCPTAAQMYKNDPTSVLDPVEQHEANRVQQAADREDREAAYQEARAQRKADAAQTMKELEERMREDDFDPSDPFADMSA